MFKAIFARPYLFFIMVLIVSACKTESNGSDVALPSDYKTDFPTKVIGETCAANISTQEVNIVHLADLHGRFGFGLRNYEKLHKFYQNTLVEQPYTLFTNAGDDYEKGSVSESLSAGAAVREAVFAMGFDARTLGNHDFAWGIDELREFTDDPNAIVFSTNTDYNADDEKPLKTEDYAEFKLGCVTIGMFGMVSEPWNELDEQYEGDFLPEVSNDWRLTEIAQDIVNKHRDDVDILIMLSHLGEGTDIDIVTAVSGIDLVLGGHSHGGATYNKVNDSVVIQPTFFAAGLNKINIEYDINDKRINRLTNTVHYTEDMTEHSKELAIELDKILARYAPTAHSEVGYSEYGYYPEGNETVATIVSNAIVEMSIAEATLLDKSLVWTPWRAGALTPQLLNDAYKVERQNSNTPGFNAIYTVNTTGNMLKAMLTAQPDWVSQAPSSIVDDQVYTVALHKNAALNPSVFFTENIEFSDVKLHSETWALMETYSKLLTQNCQFVDTKNTLYTCRETTFTQWHFTNADTPLLADLGVGTIQYRDTNRTGWGAKHTQFGLTSEFNIKPLPDGDARVMRYINTARDQGYQVNHGLPVNGEYESENKLSSYTLIMDLYWDTTKTEWGALLQTSTDNSNDADLFSHEELSQGLGVSIYRGSLASEQWHRIAFIVNASNVGGSIDIYIDGEFQGYIGDVNQRWALDDMFYLFTDNNDETRSGYLNALLLVDRPLSAGEVATLGGASVSLDSSILIKSN